MTKAEKYTLVGIAALVVVILLYWWYSSSVTTVAPASATPTTTAPESVMLFQGKLINTTPVAPKVAPGKRKT